MSVAVVSKADGALAAAALMELVRCVQADLFADYGTPGFAGEWLVARGLAPTRSKGRRTDLSDVINACLEFNAREDDPLDPDAKGVCVNCGRWLVGLRHYCPKGEL